MNRDVNKDVATVILSEKELDEILAKLAAEIDKDYAGKKLVLVCVLKGAMVFCVDLMKKITVPLEIEYMRASSYGSGTVSTGKINVIIDLPRADISDCDLLVIEDIIDSGRTLKYIIEYLKTKGAKSIKTCTMLDKPSRREVDFNPDYTGAVIPDEFVVGYGLDYDEKYRELPYVGILKREVYEK